MSEENKQTETKFTPNPEHIVFADAYILARGNISEACKSLGDESRHLYYAKTNGYRNIEGFDAWLSEYAKQEILKRIGKWYLIAEKYAEDGSYQHLNMLMQIAKEFLPKQDNIVVIIQQNRYKDVKDEDLDGVINSYLKRR